MNLLDLVSESLASLALLHADTGDMAEAHRCGEEALRLAREFHDQRVEVLALGAIANALARSGTYDESRARYRAAEEIATRLGYRFGVTRALVGLAEVALWSGDPAAALAAAERAVDEAGRGGFRAFAAKAARIQDEARAARPGVTRLVAGVGRLHIPDERPYRARHASPPCPGRSRRTLSVTAATAPLPGTAPR